LHVVVQEAQMVVVETVEQVVLQQEVREVQLVLLQRTSEE
jgi:hypothetical protein